MSSIISISDDDSDDTINMDTSDQKAPEVLLDISSDEEKSPEKDNRLRQTLINSVFKSQRNINSPVIKAESNSSIGQRSEQKSLLIEAVNVCHPVNPYPSQKQVMSQMLRAIKNGKNCLVESPTGTGKTLALLCAALAWQKGEKESIIESQITNGINQINRTAEYNASPIKNNSNSTEALFAKQSYGEKSIYDCVETKGTSFLNIVEKRTATSMDTEDCSYDDLVKIHKKQRFDENGSAQSYVFLPSTPEKQEQPGPSTPQKKDISFQKVENLACRISMDLFCRLPVIYYGARTHKQLQQVIKEFSRTAYCGDADMTILSSRDNSCIREFDRTVWASRNDMCRSCIKPIKNPRHDETTKIINSKKNTNCKYFDNRDALNYDSLPPSFDLNEMKDKGEEISACPYYAAKELMKTANIVFCPYNYIIEPTIRKSMQITLHNNVVIIDEGHNIEDICRDAASLTFTLDEIEGAIKELKYASALRFANNENIGHMEALQRVLENWLQWFENQVPLVENSPKNGKIAAYDWNVSNFLDSLNNHDIGPNDYSSFNSNVSLLCKKLRENPDAVVGVTQATGNLLEALDTVLGYIIRQYRQDYKPILELKIKDFLLDDSWKNLQYNKSLNRDSYTLRLICLNPAIVFSQLTTARSVILASGTLAPINSLELELGVSFPLKISSRHVIARERIWIGTVTKFPNGAELKCTSANTKEEHVQDALGAVLQGVCNVTPHGVLCFLPSYSLLSVLMKRWKKTGLWRELQELKQVFVESTNTKDHDINMEQYNLAAASGPGALLLAVFRGKAAEGMDFKDRQARAVVIVGVPYPNFTDKAVSSKMAYNDRNQSVNINVLSGKEWYDVQAYRALNQAVGRCVRHAGDWGAVVLLDSRFGQQAYTKYLPEWVKGYLGENNHDVESLVNESSSLKKFMERMMQKEKEG